MLPKLVLVMVFVTVTESKLEQLGFSHLISWFHLGCLLSTPPNTPCNSRNNPVLHFLLSFLGLVETEGSQEPWVDYLFQHTLYRQSLFYEGS